MGLLATTDFVGKYNIADATSGLKSSALVECISKYESKYIYELLGAVLGQTMIDYITASQTPVVAALKALIDPFAADNNLLCNIHNKQVMVSSGLKEYLKAAVYFEYKKSGLKDSLAGTTKAKAEVSETQTNASILRHAEMMYNDQLKTAEAIQWKCRTNYSTYPTYNGVPIKIKASMYGM